MKKLSLLLISLLLLTGCGAPSEDTIYEDVVSILEKDLPEKGLLSPDLSSQEMTEFEELGDGLYEVKGNVDSPLVGVYSYTMKIKYDGGDWVEYEWVTE
jgi:uncharacterized protein YcfL